MAGQITFTNVYYAISAGPLQDIYAGHVKITNAYKRNSEKEMSKMTTKEIEANEKNGRFIEKTEEFIDIKKNEDGTVSGAAIKVAFISRNYIFTRQVDINADDIDSYAGAVDENGNGKIDPEETTGAKLFIHYVDLNTKINVKPKLDPKHIDRIDIIDNGMLLPGWKGVAADRDSTKK